MRNVPYPIVILTAAHYDAKLGKAVPLGTVLSSFNTVTLDPPIVSFNIRNPSRTLDAIRADGGRFMVHFMEPTAQSAAVADKFTRGNTHKAYKERLEGGNVYMKPDPDVQPAMISNNIVIGRLDCRLLQEITVADHFIVVAEVSDVALGKSFDTALAYVKGEYILNNSEPLKPIDRAIMEKFNSFSPQQLSTTSHIPATGHKYAIVHTLRLYLVGNPHYFQMPLGKAVNALREELGFLVRGINLHNLILSTPRNENPPTELDNTEGEDLFYQFSGPISCDEITIIVDRFRALLRADPHALRCSYQNLYHRLDVDP